MGTVYRARDTVLQRPVALKILAARQSQTALARFEREARTVAALRHPGIVTLLDAGEEGGVPYIVMELVDGEPLSAAIRRGLAPADAARIVRQVAEALASAHAAGVIHRDLTPGNIFLDRSGVARLGDFGIAKSERLEGDATRLSRTGAIIGTPSYMAPEVLAGQEATARSDVYSLGVVLYEAMTRRLPHAAESVIELVSRISAEAPATPSSLAEIPEALSSICMKALERDPARRYASAQELADDLARAGEAPRAGFLLRELAANRLRSSLALMGLAGSTASVLVLVSLALGARRVATTIFEKTPGIFVVQRNAIPHYSHVPAGLEDKFQALPGVTAADPEVWAVAFEIEHAFGLFAAVNAPTLAGVDPAKHAKLSGGGVFARNLVAGRPLAPADANGILISTPIAHYYKKHVGDTINVLDRDFVVTGIFATGSALWDGFLVAHERAVHDIAQLSSGTTSFYFIEAAPEANRAEVSSQRISKVLPGGLETGTTEEWAQGGLDFVSGFDSFVLFFGVAVGLLGALAVGNAMILSVRERARELRILRSTRGRFAVLMIVLVESLILGAAGALAGVVLGELAALLAAAVLPLTPSTPVALFVGCFAFGTLLGAVGGFYPAVAAMRLGAAA
jgi:ABC-type antimicrobial peptide transport system permease subunit